MKPFSNKISYNFLVILPRHSHAKRLKNWLTDLITQLKWKELGTKGEGKIKTQRNAMIICWKKKSTQTSKKEKKTNPKQYNEHWWALTPSSATCTRHLGQIANKSSILNKPKLQQSKEKERICPRCCNKPRASSLLQQTFMHQIIATRNLKPNNRNINILHSFQHEILDLNPKQIRRKICKLWPFSEAFWCIDIEQTHVTATNFNSQTIWIQPSSLSSSCDWNIQKKRKSGLGESLLRFIHVILTNFWVSI